MTKGTDETLSGYFGEFFRAPVLKVWEPTDFDRRYYSTPRRLANETEKRNAAYRKDFDRETRWYDEKKSALAEIAALPLALREFFAETARRYVEEARDHIADLKEQIGRYEAESARSVKFVYESVYGNDGPHEAEVDFLRDISSIKHGCYSRKEDALRPYETRYHYSWAKLRALCGDAEGQLALIRGHERYLGLKDELNSARQPGAVFADLLGHFANIAAKIKAVLGGEPDSVSLAQGWGAGRHYNGVVGRGGKRASFKSFFAGGYNIQRLHVRFRITLLKG